MKRGNYKQHDYSIEKMPKSTRYDLAKKLKAQESEELKQIYNQNLNSFIQQKKPQQQQEYEIEKIETIINNRVLMNEQEQEQVQQEQVQQEQVQQEQVQQEQEQQEQRHSPIQHESNIVEKDTLIYLNQTGVYKNLNPGSNVDLNDETTQDGSPQEC